MSPSMDLFAPGRNLVLIVAPWRTRTNAEDYARQGVESLTVQAGDLPVFAPYLLDHHLSDEDPAERATALSLSASVARTVAFAGGRCVVVGERRTEGMLADLAAWAEIEGAPAPEVRA